MNFKAGVIVSGPMLWEFAPGPYKWRRLASLETNDDRKIPVPLPIRYGSKSAGRQNTYRIVYSNHAAVLPGQGYILELSERTISSLVLKNQGVAAGAAEGVYLWEGASLKNLTCTVGLLLHPEIAAKHEQDAGIIRRQWSARYASFKDFDPLDYCIDGEAPVIDENGLMHIPWTAEMNEFDILFVPINKPDPRRLLLPEEIAAQIKASGYRTYFENNVETGIRTFQDDEIIRYLNS